MIISGLSSGGLTKSDMDFLRSLQGDIKSSINAGNVPSIRARQAGSTKLTSNETMSATYTFKRTSQSLTLNDENDYAESSTYNSGNQYTFVTLPERYACQSNQITIDIPLSGFSNANKMLIVLDENSLKDIIQNGVTVSVQKIIGTNNNTWTGNGFDITNAVFHHLVLYYQDQPSANTYTYDPEYRIITPVSTSTGGKTGAVNVYDVSIKDQPTFVFAPHTPGISISYSANNIHITIPCTIKMTRFNKNYSDSDGTYANDYWANVGTSIIIDNNSNSTQMSTKSDNVFHYTLKPIFDGILNYQVIEFY